MQYYIGSAKFIGLEILSNIGYRNIGYRQNVISVQHYSNLHDPYIYTNSTPCDILSKLLLTIVTYCHHLCTVKLTTINIINQYSGTC